MTVKVVLVDQVRVDGRAMTIHPKFRVIIAGSRGFCDYCRLAVVCDKLLQEIAKSRQITVISGGANGADSLGEHYAQERGYALILFPAKWEQYGKAAGPIRNRQMADNSDALIAFWDGHSLGTRNMIVEATRKGIEVRIIKV